MNLTKELRRTRHRLCLAPEVLEDRVVLSAGEGSTFAIMPGTVTTAGQVSTIDFKIDPTMFTTPKKNGDIVLGIDIAAATATSCSSTTSTLKPEIVSVTDPSGHVDPSSNMPSTTPRSPRRISSAIRHHVGLFW